MRFSPYDMHVERFATSTWTQTKEIAVVRQFPLAFLTGNINSYRHSLTVCIIDLQRCVLTLREFSLYIKHPAASLRVRNRS